METSGGAFGLVVALHAGYPIALAVEVLALGARPPSVWPALLMVYIAAEALRVWAIVSLGDRWNVRIWSVPREAPVTRGPYGLFRHPNYAAVVVQLAVGPLLFGAWRTALAASAVNLLVLALRIPREERALGLRP